MVRPKKGNFKMVPLNLDYEEYSKFENSLPRRKSVSEAIREYIKSVNLETEKEKNLSSPNYSAISVKPIYDIYISSKESNKHNETLDVYLVSKHEIRNHIDNINDIQILAQLEDKAKVIHTVARTKKLEIIPIEKLKNGNK